MSPVIRECERRGLEHFILHTGQHYSYNMDRVFFEELGLPEAKYNLEAGSGAHGEQTGRMMAGIERVLMDDSPILFNLSKSERTACRIVLDALSFDNAN